MNNVRGTTVWHWQAKHGATYPSCGGHKVPSPTLQITCEVNAIAIVVLARHPQSSTTCRAKPGRAKRGRAVNRALRARIRRKLEATELEANKRGANQLLWEAGKRALRVRDIFVVFERFFVLPVI